MGQTGQRAERGRRAGPAAWETIQRLCRESLEQQAPIAIESSVLIGYLTNVRPVAGLMAAILEHPAVRVVVSAFTITEVLVRPARIPERAAMSEIVASINALPALEVIEFDQAHAVETAAVRAETRLKFPDAAIVATARRAHAVALIGNDREWIGRPLGIAYVHMNHLLDPEYSAAEDLR